jgi:metacaspase-1
MIMTKKALCVGINNFKNYPENELNGCINDADDMKKLLIKYMGFKEKEITKITDSKATKKNIMKNLKEMVNGAKDGKYNALAFSLSSHGTQIPDTSGDEKDRADEAFCPHDLAIKGNIWDPDHIITDDELHDLFIQLPEEVSLEVYLDTCHSGSGLKAMEPLTDRKPRYIPPPSAMAFKKIDIIPKINQPLLNEGASDQILWAACKSDQTSADANIDGDYHGAFTYFFCKEVNASKNQISRNEILNLVVADLKAEEYTQTPQLECDATTRTKSLG